MVQQHLIDDIFACEEFGQTMQCGGSLDRTESIESSDAVAGHCDSIDVVTTTSSSTKTTHAVQPFPSPVHSADPPDWRARLPRPLLWLLSCLLVGGGLMAWGLMPSVSPDSGPADTLAASVAEGPTEYVTKNIEDIQEGDYVLARDEFGEVVGWRRVVDVFRRESDHLRVLTFRSRDGSEQTLETTDEHPFALAGSTNFLEAKHLCEGELVQGTDGAIHELVATHYEPHPEGIAVYNFEVEGYHTYYVRAQGTRGPPVLVHNAKKYSDAAKAAHRSAEEGAEEYVSLWRASRRGHGADDIAKGYNPKHFPRGGRYDDGRAYFGRDRWIAEEYMGRRGYEDYVTEIRIPRSKYEKLFKSFEADYVTSTRKGTEVRIPREFLEALNLFSTRIRQ